MITLIFAEFRQRRCRADAAMIIALSPRACRFYAVDAIQAFSLFSFTPDYFVFILVFFH